MIDPRPKTILLIDDDINIRVVIKKLLSSYLDNTKIYTSDKGIEGLGLAYILDPDVIILDTTLPKYSGREVIDYITSNEKLKKAKIILLHEDNDISQLSNLGSYYYILSKKNPKLLEGIINFLNISLGQTDKKSPQRFLIAFGKKVIKFANSSNINFSVVSSKANIFKKAFNLFKFLINQVVTIVFLALFLIFVGKPKEDATIEQDTKDFKSYRTKVYPAIALGIATIALLLIQSMVVLVGVISTSWTATTPVRAASYTWDGGGTTNNWSDCTNWSTNVCPTATDDVTFNATSVKNSNVNGAYVGTVNSISIAAGYTGTITLSRSLTVTAGFTQVAGTFTAAAQTLIIGGAYNATGAAAGTVFTASSATTTFRNAMTFVANLTFNHNGGTVRFDPTVASVNASCASKTFNVVQINAATNSNLVNILAACTFNLGANPTATRFSLSGTMTGSGTLTLNTTSTTVLNTGGAITGFTGLVQSAGSLNTLANWNLGSYNPVTLTGLTVGGGTFTAPTGTMTINANFVVSGGTFTHNSGTISFAGGSASLNCGSQAVNVVSFASQTGVKVVTNCTFNLGASPTIPNGLTVSTGGVIQGTGTFTSTTGTFTVQNTLNTAFSGFTGLSFGGNFVLQALTANTSLNLSAYGVVNFDAHVFIATPGGGFTNTFVAKAGGIMTVGGGFEIQSGTVFTHSSGTVAFDGTTSSTIICAGTGGFNLVTMGKSAGNTVVSAGCTLPLGNNPNFGLGNPITLNGTLSGSGTLNLGSGAFTYQHAATFSGFTGISGGGIFTMAATTANTALNLSTYTTAAFDTSFIMNTPTGFTNTFTAPEAMSVAGPFTLNSGTTYNAWSQILVDADMETAGVASWTATNATLTKQTVVPHGGTQLLRVVRTAGGSSGATQNILTIGKTYRIQGFARGDGVNSPEVITNTGTVLWTGTVPSVWQAFDVTFVATATNIRLSASSTVGNYAEFDDIQVNQEKTLTFNGTTTATATCNSANLNKVVFAHTAGVKTVAANCSMYLGVNPVVGSGGFSTLSGSFTGTGTLTHGTGSFTVTNGGTISGFQNLITNGSFTQSATSVNTHVNLSTFVSAEFKGTFSLSTPTGGFTNTFTPPYGEMKVLGTFTINSGAVLNSPHSTQLLADGNMEAGGTSSWTAQNSATLSKQTGTPHGGTQLLRIAYGGTAGPQARQGILTPGLTYRATGWGRGDGVDIFVVRDGITNIFTGTSSTSWQEFDVVFTATDPNFRLRSETSSPGGFAEFDDVSITPYNSLNFYGTGSTSNLTCSGTQTFNIVDFTHTGGTKVVASACSMPIGADPTVGAGGDVTLNGTFTGSGTLTTTGIFTVSGSGTLTTFTGYAGNNLIISKAISFSTYTSFTVASNLTLNAAVSLTMPTAGADVDGSVIISDGTFVAPTPGILHIGGALTITASGTLTPGSGTVDFDGTADASSACLSQPFNLVTITHTAGNKIFNSACTLPMGANPTIAAGGNTQINGTVTGSGTLTSTGKLTLLGSAAFTTFTGYIGDRLSIGKNMNFSSYTSFTIATELELTANTLTMPTAGADINGNLVLITGTFNAPSGTMTISGSVNINPAATFNHNSGTITIDGTENAMTTGQVGYWKMDEIAANSCAGGTNDSCDSSGNNIDMAWAGAAPTIANGKFGNALDFESTSSQYMSAADSAPTSITSSFTISSWVYQESDPASTAPILAKDTSNPNRSLYLALNNAGAIRFLVSSDGTTIAYVDGTTSLSFARWTHVAGVYDASAQTLKIYVDGVLDTATLTGTVPASIHDGNAAIRIGSNERLGDYFDGSLDDVRLYNTALSASDIRDLYFAKSAIDIGCPVDSSCFPVYNFIINKANSTDNAYISVNHLRVASTLTVTKGILNQYYSNIRVEGSSAISVAADGTLSNTSTGDIIIGGTVANSGLISLQGTSTACGETDAISITSTVGATQRAWSGGGTFTMNDVSVQDQGGSVNIPVQSGTSVSGNGTNWLFLGCGNSAPNSPSSLTQTRNSGVSIPDAQWIEENTVKFSANISDPDNPDFLYLCVEMEAVNTSFTNVEDGCSSLTAYSGSAVAVTYTASGVADSAYHWQARTKDITGVYSAWTYFGDLIGNTGNYYKMNENTGTSTADSSGNGNTATLENGAAWTTGKFGSGVSLDGVNDDVAIPDSPQNDFDTNQDFTVNLWAKIPTTQVNTSATVNAIIEKYTSGSGSGYPYVLRVRNQTDANPGRLTFARYDGTNSDSANTTASYNDNTFHMFTLKKNGSTISIYVDGVLAGSGSDASVVGSTANSSPVYLGKRGGGATPFSGVVDDFRSYARALSDTEIADLFQQAEALSWWKFDECSGSTIADSAGGGATATLTVGASGSQTSIGNCATGSTAWGNGILGKYSNSVSLDDTDDYVTATIPSIANNSFTVSTWSYRTSLTSAYEFIIAIGSEFPNVDENLHITYLPNSVIRCGFFGDDLDGSGTWTSDVNVWVNITCAYDATTNLRTLYRNGVLIGSNTAGGDFSGTGQTFIGKSHSNIFPGKIDDIRVFNSALTQNQVSAIYNSGTYRDFGVDTGVPTGGVVYDGTTTAVDVTYNNGSLSSLSANWDSFNFTPSGLSSYDYSIGTTIGGTDIKNWTGNGTTTSVTATGLTLESSVMYYFNVRGIDTAGNNTVVSSNGQLVAPTLTFSLSSSTITFNPLNNLNGYSDTETTTLTTSTNAFNGYVIRAFERNELRRVDNPAITIPDFSNGTYANPGDWPGGVYGFGYTSNDTTIQGSNKFSPGSCPTGGGSPPCYAPFVNATGPGDIVADHTPTVSGTPITNEQFIITYKVQISNTQPAGSYATTIVYSIIPQY